MNVNQSTYSAGVNNAIPGYTNSTAAKAKGNKNITTDLASDANFINDVYDKNKSKDYSVNYDAIQKTESTGDVKLDAFRDLVRKLLLKQGDASQKAEIGNKMVDIDAETRAAAQELISEDGYFGVKKTSERILDFAKAVAGNDPDKIEKMRTAVEKGFEAAEKVWGDKLPDISQQTYDAVMKGFDEWAASAKNPEQSQ